MKKKKYNKRHFTGYIEMSHDEMLDLVIKEGAVYDTERGCWLRLFERGVAYV